MINELGSSIVVEGMYDVILMEVADLGNVSVVVFVSQPKTSSFTSSFRRNSFISVEEIL